MSDTWIRSQNTEIKNEKVKSSRLNIYFKLIYSIYFDCNLCVLVTLNISTAVKEYELFNMIF